jgi:hypothetical protein
MTDASWQGPQHNRFARANQQPIMRAKRFPLTDSPVDEKMTFRAWTIVIQYLLYCTNLLSSLAASLQVLIAANFALDSHLRQWIAQWVQAKRNDYLIVFDEFSHLSFVC